CTSAQRSGIRSDRRGQRRRAHEPSVDRRGTRPAFGDGPHDQALTASHVAAHVHAVAIRGELSVTGDVAALVELDAELLEQALPLWPDEAHRQQRQLALELEVAALDLLELPIDHLDFV